MSIKTLDVSDVSKVSPRDIYMRLCACRDFEIKLQWERAVFLTAFLIACFAGYGSFLLSIHQYGSGTGNFSPLAINGIFILLTVVGIVLSLFWILMAKGSKAWYEHYEQAIAAFAKNHATPDVPEYLMAHQWRDMPNIARNPMSDCIFDFKGGAYSVSKIVIAIGICSLVIWGVLFLLHCGVAVFGPISTWKVFNWALTIIVGVVGCFVIVHVIMLGRLGSGYLGKMKVLLPEENSNLKRESWTPNDGRVIDWIYKRILWARWYVLKENDKLIIYRADKSIKAVPVGNQKNTIKVLRICEDGLYSLGCIQSRTEEANND